MPGIISAVAQAGAVAAGYVPLRLPYGVAPLFEEWLTLHRPLQKEKILGRIREIRGGKLNDPDFGTRMQGSGAYAEHISEMWLQGPEIQGMLSAIRRHISRGTATDGRCGHVRA